MRSHLTDRTWRLFPRNWFRILLPVLLVFLTAQTACIWKLWSKGPPIEEREFDVYGTVQTVDSQKLVIQSREGELEFDMVDSSIKGSDFGEGALVHVYYRIRDGNKQVTMVVEKID